MKRSKIMLGLAALLFAGVGAFASINTPPEEVSYFQDEAAGTGCTPVTLDIDCPVTNSLGCREFILVENGTRQLYSDTTCQTPLDKDAGF